MLKSEFTAICQQYNAEAFKDLTDETYCEYESLYNELDDFDKETYCKLLMTDLPRLLANAAGEIGILRAMIQDLTSDKEKLTHGLIEGGDYETLGEVYDAKTIIGMKLDSNDMLTNEEIQYVKDNLK